MSNAKPELELGDLRDQRNALIESGIDPNGLGEPLGIVEQLKGRAQFLEDRSEVKSPGLLREAAALISQLQNTINVLQDNQAEYIGTITRLECENIDLTAERDEARHEVDHFTSSGIAEVAVRNTSVMDYMKHWEGRAEAAEKRIKILEEDIQNLHHKILNPERLS